MKVAITGGSGFIGSHASRHLTSKGYDVIIISRGEGRTLYKSAAGEAIRTVTWEEAEADPTLLEKLGAWIHLAGETINRRWTKAGKQAIMHSRIETTRRAVRLIERLQTKPEVVLNGSAIGVYGSSLEQTFDERSPVAPPEGDFLAEVASRWEEESRHYRVPRVVRMRIGLVLGANGGALPKMMILFRLGIGGKIGHGRQWMSWIHIEDMVRAIETCIRDRTLEGAVNFTAPEPVRNLAFTQTLARTMARPAFFPLPAFMLRLVLGEMSGLLTEGQRVLPRKLLEHGFSFRYPRLSSALEAIRSRSSPSL